MAGGVRAAPVSAGVVARPPSAIAQSHAPPAAQVRQSAAGAVRYSDVPKRWMNGRFDSNRGVLLMTWEGGDYQLADQNRTGRFDNVVVTGAVMSGDWSEDKDAVAPRCRDGRFHGRFRFTFQPRSFSGGYGYCDEPPTRPWFGSYRDDGVR
jgi:hypothetical protein